jgi:hypothetical protein
LFFGPAFLEFVAGPVGPDGPVEGAAVAAFFTTTTFLVEALNALGLFSTNGVVPEFGFDALDPILLQVQFLSSPFIRVIDKIIGNTHRIRSEIKKISLKQFIPVLVLTNRICPIASTHITI